VSDDRNKELVTARRASSESSEMYSARQSSADLLDLVRSAEEAATLATNRDEPARLEDTDDEACLEDVEDGADSEDFVDVGDDAIDAPASLPPTRAATPAKAFRPKKHLSMPKVSASQPPLEPPPRPAPAPPTQVEAADDTRRVPPLIGIVLPLAIAIIALIAATR
jgi:hypothetical protein